MNNKEIIKYFYEVVVSENLLDELPQYISENCVQKIGEHGGAVNTFDAFLANSLIKPV